MRIAAVAQSPAPSGNKEEALVSLDQFRQKLHAQFELAVARGATHLRIKSEELAAPFPRGGSASQHLSCCEMMLEEMRVGDVLVETLASDQEVHLTVRYVRTSSLLKNSERARS